MNDVNLTEWDSSKATLMRIDDALRRAAQASMMRDLTAWYRELQVLKREAYAKMPRKESHKDCKTNGTDKKYCQRCHCDKLFRELDSNMQLYARQRRKGNFSELEETLDKAELFLRDFMDTKGMMMRDKKSAMDRFQEG